MDSDGRPVTGGAALSALYNTMVIDSWFVDGRMYDMDVMCSAHRLTMIVLERHCVSRGEPDGWQALGPWGMTYRGMSSGGPGFRSVRNVKNVLAKYRIERILARCD